MVELRMLNLSHSWPLSVSRGRLLKGSPLRNNIAAKDGGRPTGGHGIMGGKGMINGWVWFVGSLKKQPSARTVEHFHEFLKMLKKPAAEDILTNLKTWVGVV